MIKQKINAIKMNIYINLYKTNNDFTLRRFKYEI